MKINKFEYTHLNIEQLSNNEYDVEIIFNDTDGRNKTIEGSIKIETFFGFDLYEFYPSIFDEVLNNYYFDNFMEIDHAIFTELDKYKLIQNVN